MIRLTFGGEGLCGFDPVPFSDSYVKLQLPPPGADYGPPFETKQIKATRPKQQWFRQRTYTVKTWDPENRLLGRGPRRRMPAWMIRDHALACSGLLVDTRGGPPVKPYQPAGIWSETTFGTIVYERDQDDDAHRRSLYTFWRRIVGPPVFFDNADRRNCAVRTTMTNTPLHALTTLNDTTFVEAARVMAARIMKDGGDQDADRVDFAFKLAASRIPTDAEREILLTRLDVLRKQYHQRPGAAAELLSVGDAAPAQNLDANDQAAFTGICTLILNLDEVLTR